jgi:MSHA biogenesis protein MshL
MKKVDRVLPSLAALTLFFALMATGCTTSQSSQPVSPQYPVPAPVMKSRPELPSLPPLAEIKPRAAMEENMPFETRLFTLNIMDAQLQEIVLPMAQSVGLNLVFDRDVDVYAPVSASFANLPLRRALELILDSHGYYFTINGNVLSIKAMETRVFQLNHSLVASQGSSSISGDSFDVSSESDDEALEIWDVLEEALGAGGSGGGGGSGQQKSMLSENGHAQINKMAGFIIVTDRPENLDRMARYLDALENSLQRQVLIEARLVEVALTEEHEYGIDWSVIGASLGSGWNLDIASGIGAVVQPAVGGAANPDLGSFATSLSKSGSESYNVVLNALAQNGSVNVLSAPRIAVMNNQSAMINMTTELPYEETSVTVQDGDRLVEYTIQRVFEGVSLGITPQIDPSGMTTLLIVPRVAQNQRFEDFTMSKKVPVLTVRETSTMVRVPNGGTVLLGGIIEEKTDDRVTKIPILGDLPVLGKALFSSQKRENKKVELIIMITATIIEG